MWKLKPLFRQSETLLPKIIQFGQNVYTKKSKTALTPLNTDDSFGSTG